MKLPINQITIWSTDEVLDFLDDKEYKNKTLKELETNTSNNIVISHLSVTHTLADVPMYVMIVKTVENTLQGIVGTEAYMRNYIATLAVEEIISDYQYNLLINAVDTL